MAVSICTTIAQILSTLSMNGGSEEPIGYHLVHVIRHRGGGTLQTNKRSDEGKGMDSCTPLLTAKTFD